MVSRFNHIIYFNEIIFIFRKDSASLKDLSSLILT